MGDRDEMVRRWAELMDRRALGDPLTVEELAFCEQLAAEDPGCAREVELLDELAELDVPPSAESRALVDATLARLAAENQELESARVREELSHLRRPGRMPRLIWIMGGVAAAAVATALFVFRPIDPPEPPPTGMPVVPRVELVYAAGQVLVDGAPVAFGATLLSEGSAISVGRGSACIAMDPGIDLCAGANTKLVLARTHGPWRRVDLLEGKVGVQLQPQPVGHRLSIVANEVWATALGTAFTVENSAENGVRTMVLHGKVRVGSDGGDEQIVTEHQLSEVRGKRATVAAVRRNEESTEWALLRPAKLWSNPVSATLEVRGAPEFSQLVLDGQPIGMAPLSTLIPAGAHKLTLRVDGRIVATREFVSEIGQLTVISFEGQELGAREAVPAEPEPASRTVRSEPTRQPRAAALEAVTPEPALEAEAVPAASEMLADARRLLRSERFADAAARYQALRDAYPHSPEAHTVLVSLAEIELDRLGDPAGALAHLDEYLREGRGSLLEEARLARIRALRALGRSGEEAAAIAEFVQEHPRNFNAAALERRLAELGASE